MTTIFNVLMRFIPSVSRVFRLHYQRKLNPSRDIMFQNFCTHWYVNNFCSFFWGLSWAFWHHINIALLYLGSSLKLPEHRDLKVNYLDTGAAHGRVFMDSGLNLRADFLKVNLSISWKLQRIYAHEVRQHGCLNMTWIRTPIHMLTWNGKAQAASTLDKELQAPNNILLCS